MNAFTRPNTSMELTQAEIKLILRIRRLRQERAQTAVLVIATPMALLVTGEIEHLESSGFSGSAVTYNAAMC